MYKYDDLTGKKFNRLLVIKVADRKNGRVAWLCKCDCGNEKVILAQSLKAGWTKSCGCLHIETNRIKCEYSKLKEPGEAGLRMLLCRYKNGAKKRKFKWELTKEQFKEITDKKCYYCDQEPNQITTPNNSNHIGEYKHNGIDRVNNNLGYLIDNCVPCCKMCNRSKMSLSSEEFINMSIRIYKKHGV